MKIKYEPSMAALEQAGLKAIDALMAMKEGYATRGIGGLHAVKEMEARAVLEDEAAETPIIDAECERCGAKRKTLARKIVKKAEATRKSLSALELERQRLRSDLYAAIARKDARAVRRFIGSLAPEPDEGLASFVQVGGATFPR